MTRTSNMKYANTYWHNAEMSTSRIQMECDNRCIWIIYCTKLCEYVDVNYIKYIRST